MPAMYSCPKGHEWSEGDSKTPWNCPTCGAGSVTLTGDQLPPPPRNGASTPTRTPTPPGYEIIGELGRGGMGVVYKAKQLSLNRIVALKTLRSGADADAQEESRFRAEAEAAANLQHPHIIQVYDVGSFDGRLFCAMEFVAGGTLADRLANGPLPPNEAATLAETLARAVHAAHEMHIIHRDLKPQNVLLMKDGTPKVADFGLAKRLDLPGQTQSGAIMGTPCYMAPEQAEGRTADFGPWTDVWALGAILYELLTGRPPFRADSPFETMLQVVKKEPDPPWKLNPKVPRDLGTICLKCLKKSRAERYPSAKALAEDLHRFLDSGSYIGPPSSPPRKGNKAMLVGLIAILLLGGGLIALRPWGDKAANEGTVVKPEVPPANNGTVVKPEVPPTPAVAVPEPPPALPAGIAAGPEWEYSTINPADTEEKFDRIAFSTRYFGYAASRSAFYRTNNGGRTWVPVGLSDLGRVFALHISTTDIVWLGTDRLRKTENGGRTWADVPLPGNPLRAVTAVALQWDNTLLAGGTDSNGELILFRSDNKQEIWEKVKLPVEFNSWFLSGIFHRFPPLPYQPDVSFVVMFRGRSPGGVILRSTDRGTTWKEVLKAEVDFYQMGLGPDGRGWLIGSDGLYWRTENNGESWAPATIPGTESLSGSSLAVGPSGSPVVIPLMSGRVAFAADGQTWTVLDLGREGFGYSMPSAFVVDAGCAFVLSADGRLARYLDPRKPPAK